MTYPTNEDREKAKQLIIERLNIGPLSLDEMTDILSQQSIPMPRGTAKYIFWDLVEEGLAVISTKWYLEEACE